jgi:hypothetical protein
MSQRLMRCVLLAVQVLSALIACQPLVLAGIYTSGVPN